MTQEKRQVLLVTGLSGAGLSTALKALEDLGWKVVDNLPLSLIDPLLSRAEGRAQPVALGIDSRTWDFSATAFEKTLEKLRCDDALRVRVLFIDCADGVLQQRFTETRRRHPLALDRSVADGVDLERGLVGPLRDLADLAIDTSDLKSGDLRRIVAGHFTLDEGHGLLVFVTSFGYRHGLPREADLVFDVRFLDNPYYDPLLRPLTGRDPGVAARIRQDSGYGNFFSGLTALLGPLLPRYQGEGRSYLTIAIGCTGGRHRSVFVAEELFAWLDARGYSVGLRHRDMERWTSEQKALSPGGENEQTRKRESA